MPSHNWARVLNPINKVKSVLVLNESGAALIQSWQSQVFVKMIDEGSGDRVRCGAMSKRER